MDEKKKSKRVVWQDILKPSDKDLAPIIKEFRLHPVIVNELKGPSARTHVEVLPHYLFFTYFFPVYDAAEGTSTRTEIDFIIAEGKVVTVHYDSFTEIFDGVTAESAAHSLELTYRILKQLITFEERQLRHVREKVERIGKELFKNKERKILETINYLKRDISEYRIIVHLQEPILHSLISAGKKFWGDEAEIYLNDLLGDQARIASQLEAYREAIADFESTNTQLMNLKTNSVMRTLTSLSFLTFPSMVFLALFTTAARGTPIVDSPHGFWIIAGMLAALIFTLAMYFKKRDWL